MEHGARSRSRSARRSCRSGWSPTPAAALAGRVERARARARAPRTCRSRRCRTSSRRSSCSRGHMRVAERYIVYRAERALLRAQAAPAASRPGDPGAGGRRARRSGPARTCASGSRSRRSGWTCALDADALERELRRAIRPGHRPRRPAAARRAQRQGADGARRGVLAVRRPHPAHLRLRGDARLGHRARRRRRAARRRTSARSAPALRARRGDRAHRPAAARVRPRAARRGARSRPPTSTSTSSACRRSTTATCIIDKTGAKPRRIETPQLFWLRVAMGVCLARAGGASATARAIDLYATLQEPPLLLVDADAVQRRHAALAAVVLLPLQGRGHAVLDRRARASPRTRCARSGRAASAARGPRCAAPARTSSAPTARARASSRSSSCTTTSSSPSTRAASARAPAAPTSRSGTTTSASSSSCAATPATSAAARTT